jgi:hypothetical protein
MSKKKNTLKDLNEFLKQQAAQLVTPEKLSEPQDEPAPEVRTPSANPPPTPQQLSADSIVRNISDLAAKEGVDFRKKFYDLIIHTLESQKHQLAEDKMLINTALYLKHPERWKEAIREYWSQHD